MTMPFKILRADHTGITISDIKASLSFWRDTLGFKPLYRAPCCGAYAAEVTGVPGAHIDIAVLLAPGQKKELPHYLAPAGR